MYNFIVSPKTGSGRDLRVWKAIARYMDNHNIEYEVFLTEGIGGARTVARQLAGSRDEPRYIIAVGGEGTMNGALDGMFFHRPLSLGYIPAGSGGNLVRSFRMPGRTIECLRKQLTPRHFTMIGYKVPTYGNQEVSHRRSLVNAGIGPDAAVCQDALSSRCRQRSNRFSMGKLSYIFIDIHQFFKCKSSKGHILLGGIKEAEFNNILFVSYRVQPSEGGGFLFTPRTDGGDGRLNICVMSHSTRIKLIPVLLSALIGRRRPKSVRIYECEEVPIHTKAALPVHADGESRGLQTDIRASYIARKVRMVV